MRVSGTVKINDNWREYRQDLGEATARSMVYAAGLGVAACRSKPSRYNIGKIQETTRVDVPVRVPGGWIIDIHWTDFRARWFDRGTYEKLGGSKQLEEGQVRGRGKAGRYQYHTVHNRGIAPQRFMALARRVGRLALITALSRELK